MNDDDGAIERITLIDGIRIARVRGGATHGLGFVGEEIEPYLGLRSEGYEVYFDDPREVAIAFVDTALPAGPDGKHPSRRVGWGELRAADMPTIGDACERLLV